MEKESSLLMFVFSSTCLERVRQVIGFERGKEVDSEADNEDLDPDWPSWMRCSVRLMRVSSFMRVDRRTGEESDRV